MAVSAKGMVIIMGFKLYWSAIDAIIASIIGAVGVFLVYLVHPDLHPLAYIPAWLLVAGLVYQTGTELSVRRRNQQGRTER